MQNLKIKASTIARLGVLVVALVNQVLAIFGQGVLPFTENMAYQAISFVITVIIVVVNAWYNNDVTKVAILSGKVFDALNDGKLTEAELEAMLTSLESTTPDEVVTVRENFVVKIINKILATVKRPNSGG